MNDQKPCRPASRIIEGAQEALSVAKGEQPAASITVNGHKYVPASRISQQDAELERLREALKPFALAATIFEQEYGDRMKSDTGCNIKFAVLCQARAALRDKAEETGHE